MITVEQYFWQKEDSPEATPEKRECAQAMLNRVNSLLDYAKTEFAYAEEIDPDTGSQISGSKGGAGDGGFRLSGSATGKPASKHKLARAVDVYDPEGKLDAWITDDTLEEFGLWREIPSATQTWCHLQDLPPGSGKRTFQP